MVNQQLMSSLIGSEKSIDEQVSQTSDEFLLAGGVVSREFSFY
jgi:hypothetical protein